MFSISFFFFLELNEYRKIEKKGKREGKKGKQERYKRREETKNRNQCTLTVDRLNIVLARFNYECFADTSDRCHAISGISFRRSSWSNWSEQIYILSSC
jgi:hypothetical protein